MFIYLWLRWVLVSAQGLSPAAASGGHSSPRCAGPTIAASPVAEHRPQTCRPSNCGARAQPLRGTWDPPRPGPEPASPAPAGRLPTTAPPGKPQYYLLMWVIKEDFPAFSTYTKIFSHILSHVLYISPYQIILLPHDTSNQVDGFIYFSISHPKELYINSDESGVKMVVWEDT